MTRPTSRVARVQVTGPLGYLADAYTAKLKSRGYTPLTIVNELRQMAHLEPFPGGTSADRGRRDKRTAQAVPRSATRAP